MKKVSGVEQSKAPRICGSGFGLHKEFLIKTRIFASTTKAGNAPNIFTVFFEK